MSNKLTKLEKNHLKKLFDLISTIEGSKISGSDSINDFLHDQFNIETDEVQTLKIARDHFELTNNANELMFEMVAIFKEHFDI